MAVDPLSASKAYLDAIKAAQKLAAGSGGQDDKVEFGALLEAAVKDAAGGLRAAEGASLASSTGKADIVDVVTAISQAETTLETVIAVRDQVIQAYQEILRMPI